MMVTVKNALTTANWWVEPGVVDDNRVVTWMVCGGRGDDGAARTIGEFESKTLAEHVAKTHNRAVRKG